MNLLQKETRTACKNNRSTHNILSRIDKYTMTYEQTHTDEKEYRSIALLDAPKAFDRMGREEDDDGTGKKKNTWVHIKTNTYCT